MKKFLIVSIALILVMGVSVTAIAAGVEKRPEMKVQLSDEQREVIQEKRMELFETYYPEGVEEFLALQEEHKAFHIGAKNDKEALIASIRASFEEIRTLVENGDISRRDGRVQFIELKIEVRTMKNEMDLVRLDKIADQSADQDRMKEIREEVKTLLSADPVDSDAVSQLLAESLELLKNHIDSDIYYHNLILGIAASYGY